MTSQFKEDWTEFLIENIMYFPIIKEQLFFVDKKNNPKESVPVPLYQLSKSFIYFLKNPAQCSLEYSVYEKGHCGEYMQIIIVFS